MKAVGNKNDSLEQLLRNFEDLNAFENDMYDMIRKSEFTNIRNEFLDHLNRDRKNSIIKKSVSICGQKYKLI